MACRAMMEKQKRQLGRELTRQEKTRVMRMHGHTEQEIQEALQVEELVIV